MCLQGPDVSSIFAQKITKQTKRMTVKHCNFKVGEVYLFHTDDPRCPDAESLWGLYDRHDGARSDWNLARRIRSIFRKAGIYLSNTGSAGSQPAANYVITWSIAFARK